MLEIRLLTIFLVCSAVVFIGGMLAVRSAAEQENNCFLVIPVTGKTENLEFVVRTFAYRFINNYPETMVVLINFNADREKIVIFEKLMTNSCRYTIINSENNAENICNIIGNMIY